MIKTLAELKAYFQTGDKPTQTEFENLIDSTYRGYKVYTALLTQSGTNAPVDSILANNVGGLEWLYSGSVGVYFVKPLNGSFDDLSKVVGIEGSNQSGDASVKLNMMSQVYLGNNCLRVESYEVGNPPQDDVLNGKFIEIRVYN